MLFVVSESGPIPTSGIAIPLHPQADAKVLHQMSHQTDNIPKPSKTTTQTLNSTNSWILITGTARYQVQLSK